MKKIHLLILFALLSFCLILPVNAVDGEGTEESPFIITTQDELLLVGDFPDCYFKLENDIELQENFKPLCRFGDSFSGVFDGNGHTISEFNITSTANDYGGLFKKNDGVIQNLNVTTTEDYRITLDNQYYFGIICGVNTGTIANCRVKCTATVSHYWSYDMKYSCFGGICGQNTGKISQVSVAGEFYEGNNGSHVRFAAISPESSSGTISDSCANVTLPSSNSLGFAAGGTYFNCYIISNYSKFGPYLSSVNNCYYINITTDLGGVSKDSTTFSTKSIGAMKMKATYTRMGFDFENVWGINANINDGYPYLLWEYPAEDPLLMTKSSAEEFDGNIVLNVHIDQNALGKVIQAAMYDENGAPVSVFRIPNYSNKKDLTLVLPNDKKASYIKVFVWESLSSLTPLGANEEIKILRN